MLKKYLVEVCQELVTPVTVIASSKSEARDTVIRSQGEAGDTYPGDVKILRVRELGRDHAQETK
jgi:hypothetical protein